MTHGARIESVVRMCALSVAVTGLLGCQHAQWQSRLKTELPAMGHRNWIVVADSAYPKQSASGIETLVTGDDQIDVLQTVLETLGKTSHVRPVVMLDQELDSVPESGAPGITAYRARLADLLKGKSVEVKPHEAIIADLDEASQMFNVLLLKTSMTLPYTSVFIRLDCAYWDADRETRLRRALEQVVR
ncbi:MAG: hypothetical protein K9N55_20670 [Phycisphaerae bacterium]|nr:hypothetical protein [Phycisphaerae bacterium]